MIIIVDDEDRENEGDLVCAAEKVTAGNIIFMARTRELDSVCRYGRALHELHLTTQVADKHVIPWHAFTVSIDARKGVTTGISRLISYDNSGCGCPQSSAPGPGRPVTYFHCVLKSGVLVRPVRRKRV